MTLNRILSMISASPELRILELSVVTQANILPLQPVTLEHLSTLKVGGGGISSGAANQNTLLTQLIGQLITPVLSSLTVEVESRCDSTVMSEALTNLLIRSASPFVRSFTYGVGLSSSLSSSSGLFSSFHHSGFPITVLRHLHHLEELVVASCAMEPILLSLSMPHQGGLNQDMLGTPEDELLSPMTPIPGGPGPALFGTGGVGAGAGAPGAVGAAFAQWSATQWGAGGAAGGTGQPVGVIQPPTPVPAAQLPGLTVTTNNVPNNNAGGAMNDMPPLIPLDWTPPTTGALFTGMFGQPPPPNNPIIIHNQNHNPHLDDYLCPNLRKLAFKSCLPHGDSVGKIIKLVETRNPDSASVAAGLGGWQPKRLKCLEFDGCGSVPGSTLNPSSASGSATVAAMMGLDVVEWLERRVEVVKFL